MPSLSAERAAPLPLVLLRHGESTWNREGRFTGWTDVPLTPRGREQAARAGRLLAANGFDVDLCFTSSLERACETTRIVLDAMGRPDAPVRSSWRLNERHYGALQGLTTVQAFARFGPRRVLLCRRRYDGPPPLLEPGDPRLAASVPPGGPAVRGESLSDTHARILPYWTEEILPEIRAAKKVLIVSHRNTLAVLVKILDAVPDRATPRLKAPTGRPLVYEIGLDLKPLRHFYLQAPRPARERLRFSRRAR